MTGTSGNTPYPEYQLKAPSPGAGLITSYKIARTQAVKIFK